MSQRRQKKQLSSMDNVSSLSDPELREALKSYNQNPGPITDSTRNIYRKKLASLLEENAGEVLSSSFAQTVKVKPLDLLGDVDDDDDTSDEDYNEQDELSTSSESKEDDDDFDEGTDENFDEDEEGDLNEDIKLSSTTTDTLNSTTALIGSDATPNRISRGIIIFLEIFAGFIFSAYLLSRGSLQQLTSLDIFSNVTKNLLILAVIVSGVIFVVYKCARYYMFHRQEEMQRVCDLVNEALELLQSPDNPTSSLPILHIRDTLLTPAERKTKKMTNLWTKAVKFIEEHESRVKVELVNIDGEDFRAWKWIGSRKL